MGNITNPTDLLLEGYADSSLGILFELIDENDNPIDIASDYSRVQFRAWTRGNKANPVLDVDTDGSLSITDTNKISDVFSPTDIADLVRQTAYWQLIFYFADGTQEVFLADRLVVYGAESSGGEASNEKKVQINSVTNEAMVTDAVNSAAIASKAKVDAQASKTASNGKGSTIQIKPIPKAIA